MPELDELDRSATTAPIFEVLLTSLMNFPSFIILEDRGTQSCNCCSSPSHNWAFGGSPLCCYMWQGWIPGKIYNLEQSAGVVITFTPATPSNKLNFCFAPENYFYVVTCGLQGCIQCILTIIIIYYMPCCMSQNCRETTVFYILFIMRRIYMHVLKLQMVNSRMC